MKRLFLFCSFLFTPYISFSSIFFEGIGSVYRSYSEVKSVFSVRDKSKNSDEYYYYLKNNLSRGKNYILETEKEFTRNGEKINLIFTNIGNGYRYEGFIVDLGSINLEYLSELVEYFSNSGYRVYDFSSFKGGVISEKSMNFINDNIELLMDINREGFIINFSKSELRMKLNIMKNKNKMIVIFYKEY